MNAQFKSGSTLAWKLFLVITAGVGLVLDGQLAAQTFSTLYSFASGNTNAAFAFLGVRPNAALILSSNTLYGTTYTGGVPGNGTIFSINTDGTGFTNLYSFTGASDGANPIDAGGLVLSGNAFYGTTELGSTNNSSTDDGRVFKVNLDGTGFTTLHMFTGGSDGSYPWGGLIVSGDTLYGMTPSGANGVNGGYGTVFKLSTDGSNFTTLYSFTGGSDGASPLGWLNLSGNTLFGTTWHGGIAAPDSLTAGYGTVFSLNTDGTDFRTLHIFSAGDGVEPNITNFDGAQPNGGLILSGKTLYGTASIGGSATNGTIFAVDTDGSGFRTLYSFSFTSDSPPYTNSDGANPNGDLILSGDTLYGTTPNGGSSGSGTIFSVKTNGTGFATLYNFTALSTPCYPCGTNGDGAHPARHLILAANTLYGDAAYGGLSGNGTIFSLSLGQVSPPQLSVVPSGSNILLTWPAVPTGFALQSTTNLVSPIWTTILPTPVVVNGQFTVTNPISGTQQFFRLSQ